MSIHIEYFCVEISAVLEVLKFLVISNGLLYTVDSRYILNSKGLSETLRDIRTSIYKSCRSEENNKSNNHIQEIKK